MIKEGKKKTQSLTVVKSKTAKSMKSGGLEVLATPAIVAHMEQVAYNLIKDLTGEESVGGFILVKHERPSKIGDKIKTMALITKVENRKISFIVSSFDSKGIIAQGEHVRFIIDPAGFMKKLEGSL